MPYSTVSTPVREASAILLRLIREQERLESRMAREPKSSRSSRLLSARGRVRRVHRELYECVTGACLEQILTLSRPTLPRELRYLLLNYWHACVRLKRCGVSLPILESRQVSATLDAWRWLHPGPGTPDDAEETCV